MLNKREQTRLDTREKLYHAAMEEFRRVGVSEARIGPIADSAGVSRASFYFHFPTKEDVLFEAFRRAEESVYKRLEKLEQTPKNIREALANFCDQLMRVVEMRSENDPMREAWLLLHRNRANITWNENYFGMVSGFFEQAQKRGEVRRDIASRDLTKLFLLSLFGPIVVYGLDKKQRRHEVEQLTSIFLEGVIVTGKTKKKQ